MFVVLSFICIVILLFIEYLVILLFIEYLVIFVIYRVFSNFVFYGVYSNYISDNLAYRQPYFPKRAEQQDNSVLGPNPRPRPENPSNPATNSQHMSANPPKYARPDYPRIQPKQRPPQLKERPYIEPKQRPRTQEETMAFSSTTSRIEPEQRKIQETRPLPRIQPEQRTAEPRPRIPVEVIHGKRPRIYPEQRVSEPQARIKPEPREQQRPRIQPEQRTSEPRPRIQPAQRNAGPRQAEKQRRIENQLKELM